MTRDESLTIVAMVVSSWPGKDWDAPTMDAFARNIEGMDAALTTRAVAMAVRELKYRPSVAELREFVRIEKALSEPERMYEKQETSTRLPDWVKGWCISRYRYKDMRVWQEQDSFGHGSDLMPTEMRDKYIAEGMSLSVTDVFRAIGV